ncbi:MAG TPA: hypothetical protein VGY54_18040, partial [Polyangiaceae bacterium]|nr:hypothetical protein [Polyangiaceae bacterium]
LGTLFEAAAGLVLAVTPGFEVRGAVDDPASQTDLLASYRTDAIVNASLPEGYALIECKYQERAVGSSLVRELGARCLIHGAKLGVLVVRERIAGDDNARNALAAAQLERRRLLPHGVHILVVSADDLREASRELRGLEPILREDYEVLCFGEPPATAGADSRQAAR